MVYSCAEKLPLDFPWTPCRCLFTLLERHEQIFFCNFFTFSRLNFCVFLLIALVICFLLLLLFSSPPNSHSNPNAITSFDNFIPEAFPCLDLCSYGMLLIVYSFNHSSALLNTRLTFNQKLRKLNVCTLFIQ